MRWVLKVADCKTFGASQGGFKSNAVSPNLGDSKLIWGVPLYLNFLCLFFAIQAAYHLAKPAVLAQQLQGIHLSEEKVMRKKIRGPFHFKNTINRKFCTWFAIELWLILIYGKSCTKLEINCSLFFVKWAPGHCNLTILNRWQKIIENNEFKTNYICGIIQNWWS